MYEELIIQIDDADMCSFGGANAGNECFKEEIYKIDKCQTYEKECCDGNRASRIYSSSPKEFGLIGCTWGKVYRRSLFENILKITLEYQDRIPWLFLEDIIFTPMSYMVANKVVFCKSIGYLHMDMPKSLSRMSQVKPHHYESARACDITLDYAKINKHLAMYEDYLELSLANLQSIWYKIDHFEKEKKRKRERAR